MLNSNKDMLSKLQMLRDDYARRLPQQLGELYRLAGELPVTQDPGATLAMLHTLLHRLAGSAGSFGFGELGKQAKQLELQVARWLEHENVDRGQLQIFAVAIKSLNAHTSLASQTSISVVSAPASGSRQTHIYLLGGDAGVAEEISTMLSHFGHKVSYFTDLDSAEAAIAEAPPEFIIADLEFLPESQVSAGGIAYLQKRLPAPGPVICVSHRSGFQDYLAAVHAGAVSYFTKPLDVIQLVDFFEVYLDNRRTTPYRVMIVDDDEVLAGHYQLVLEAAGMMAEVVTDPENLLPRLQEFQPEMILLDLNMPGYTGPELAQVIRLNGEWLRIPITYLSSETDIDKRISAMGQAGDDFLAKPITDRELVSAVSVRAARSRQLSQALDRDSLTGLLKHSRIKERVDLELARAVRSNEWMSVVMLDLDHFKSVNDTHGHPMGDKVIKALAHILRQRLRKTDAIGRYGGEEFVAILPACSDKEALRLIDDVRESFKALSFQGNGGTFHVTLSAGISRFEPGLRVRADELLQRADDALYLAKHNGRDCVVVAEA